MKVTYIDSMGTDLSVVNSARVSFNRKSEVVYCQGQFCDDTCENPEYWDICPRLCDQDIRLINYLAKHKHVSPFNHTFISMHVKAPIFVARQLVKHKFMPWNEVSRRYVDDEPEMYLPEWRSRPESGIKQGSGGEIAVNEDSFSEAILAALRAYDDLLSQNVAPEQARAVLPQNMYTEWYWSGTLGAWADMYNLRIDAHAQKETQEVAKQVGDIISPLFPVSWRALTSGES